MAVITKTMVVNGQRRTVTAESGMPVLWVLRDLLGLTGTKYNCGIDVCGTYTIMSVEALNTPAT